MYNQIYHTAPVTIISEVLISEILKIFIHIVLEDFKVCVYCIDGIDERKKLSIALSIPHHITGILFHLKLLLSNLFQFSIGSINVIFSIMGWPKLLWLLQYQAYGYYFCYISVSLNIFMTVRGTIIIYQYLYLRETTIGFCQLCTLNLLQ